MIPRIYNVWASPTTPSITFVEFKVGARYAIVLHDGRTGLLWEAKGI